MGEGLVGGGVLLAQEQIEDEASEVGVGGGEDIHDLSLDVFAGQGVRFFAEDIEEFLMLGELGVLGLVPLVLTKIRGLTCEVEGGDHTLLLRPLDLGDFVVVDGDGQPPRGEVRQLDGVDVDRIVGEGGVLLISLGDLVGAALSLLDLELVHGVGGVGNDLQLGVGEVVDEHLMVETLANLMSDDSEHRYFLSMCGWVGGWVGGTPSLLLG